ncbi:MAG: tetratricopeptide repeat protein [Acidobacteriota bacterium]
MVAAAIASADPSAADVAFKKGRDLMKAGKYVEACAQFEKSETLDPQIGTQFNLAQCEEKLGKLADALESFRYIADHDVNSERRSVAIDLAAQLDKRVPHIQLQVDPPSVAAAVKLGDRAVPCSNGRCDARADRGHYTVTATAAGYRDATASVDVADEGTTVIVKLVLVPAPAAPTEPKPAPPAAPEPVHAVGPALADEVPVPARSHRKLYATGAIVAGGAALATGVVFGVMANSAWNDAKAQCSGTTICTDPIQLQNANALRDDANSRADYATGFFVAGVALAAAGIVLYDTTPSEHAIAVTPSGQGVALSGRF